MESSTRPEGLQAVSYQLRLPYGTVTERSVDSNHLFIDADRACWLALSESDAILFRLLVSGATVGQAVNSCNDADVVRSLITRSIRAGFLGDRADGFAGPPVKQVQIHLANRCNLRCTHCYMGIGVTRVDERPTSDWLILLDNHVAQLRPAHATYRRTLLRRPGQPCRRRRGRRVGVEWSWSSHKTRGGHDHGAEKTPVADYLT